MERDTMTSSCAPSAVIWSNRQVQPGLKTAAREKMGLIRVLFALLNNPRVIEKLAESRLIRRAAQVTAYAITKAQIAGRDASERALRSHALRRAAEEAGSAPRDLGDGWSRFRRVRDAFLKEVKDGFREGSKQIKK